MTDTQQRAAAKVFTKNWKDRGYEKGDSQILLGGASDNSIWSN